MAVVVPANIKSSCAENERHFDVFLKTYAQRGGKSLVWYLPASTLLND